MERLVVIGGPTATGKSAFAVEIAKKYGGEIISCDSMQIYRHMDIGTAKISSDEMCGIPHHMIDIVEPTESFTVSQFADSAVMKIKEIRDRNKLPILVGGTGLYIESIIYGYNFGNSVSDECFRRKLFDEAAAYGNEYVHDKLCRIDPAEAARIHPNNVKRVIRALEIYNQGGIKKSDNINRELKYNVAFAFLSVDRTELYRKIDMRVESMCNDGLETEVYGLIGDYGVNFDMQSMQAIGYKEWRGSIDGSSTVEEVVDMIKKNSRHYAKRQITWFQNRYNNISVAIGNDEDKHAFLEHLENYYKNQLNLE